MTWLLIAQLVGLLYFAANKDRVSNKGSFRVAWVWFALIPVSRFVFALFRAGNYRSPRDLTLIEIWSDGVGWLLMAISLLFLLKALVPSSRAAACKTNMKN